MNVFEFIQNQGRTNVPNPKYNKKTKQGRNQPQFIEVPDTQPNNDSGVNLGIQDRLNGWSVDKRTSDKYAKYGINYNPREAKTTDNRFNLDNQLADVQTLSNKVWNATKQAVVSELFLGTVQGFSDIIGGLASAAHYIKSGGGNGTDDYNNAFSDYLEKARQQFDENNPIYVRNDANWYDPSSLISHIPSIAGIASMVIPSTGFVKGASLAGKAFGLGKLSTKFRLAATGMYGGANGIKDLSELTRLKSLRSAINSARGVQTANAAANLTANGIANAAMWSYAEARNVYNQNYQYTSQVLNNLANGTDDDKAMYQHIIEKNQNLLNDVDTGNPDAVAKKLAGTAADETFGKDMMFNSIFSTIQYYGLRNVWSNIKNASVTAGIRNLQRQSIKTAGIEGAAAETSGFSDEAKKLINNISKWDSAKLKVGDWLATHKGLISSNIIGGAQMGAVGFAREYGINYGKILLDQEPKTSYDDRLDDYLSNPDTWEEIIWGTIAGLGFHVTGSGIKWLGKKVFNKIESRKLVNKQITDEAKKAAESLFKDDAADVRGRKMSIIRRSSILDDYINKVKTIRDGKNPYTKGDNNELESVESGSEKELQLLKQAEDEYVSARVADAASNGTLNLEKAYMQSDEVRQALAKRIGLSDEESLKVQQSVLDKMNKAEDWYDNDFVHTMNTIQRMNDGRSDDKKIPMPYAQLIASNNLRTRLKLDEYDNAIKETSEKIDKKINQLKADNLLDSTVDYKDYYDTSITSDILGQLYVERDKIKDSKAKDASSLYALSRINEQIDALENTLTSKPDATDDRGIARTLFALTRAKGFKYNKETGEIYIDSKAIGDESKKFFVEQDKKIVTNTNEIENALHLQTLDKERGEAIRKHYDNYAGRYQRAAQHDDPVMKVDKDLAADLMTLSSQKVERTLEQKNLNYTDTQLTAKFKEYDKVYDQAAREMVEKAVSTIREINKNHFADDKDAVNMLKIIQDYANGNDITNESLNDREKASLKDAFDILDMSNPTNHELYNSILGIVAGDTAIYLKSKEQADKNKKTEDTINGTTESESKNQKASESTGDKSSNDNSSDTPRTNVGQTSGIGGNSQTQNTNHETPSEQPTNNPQVAPQQPAVATTPPVKSNVETQKRATIITNFKPVADKKGVYSYDIKGDERNKSNDDLRLVETDTPDEYEVVGNGQNLKDSFIANENFYDIEGDPLSDNLIPVNNPIVKVDRLTNEFSVVSKGTARPGQEGEVRSDNDVNTQGITQYEEHPINLDDVDRERANEREKDEKAQQSSSTGGQSESNKHKEIDATDIPTDFALQRQLFLAKNALLTAAQTTNSKLTFNDLQEKFVTEARNIGKDLNDTIVQTQIKNLAETFYKMLPENVKDASAEVKDLSELINKATAPEALKTSSKGRKSSVDELIPSTFAKEADKVIDNYITRVGTITSNGKKSISQEGILRYANDIAKTPAAATLLQSVIKSYLASDEGKSKYYVDDLNASDNTIYSNVNTDVNERLKQLTENGDTTRANIREYYLDHPDQRAAISEAIQGVKLNDKLDFEVKTVNKYGKQIVSIYIGNTQIAEIPVIDYDEEVGAYFVTIHDTNMDIRKTSRGLISNFTERIKDIMSDDSEEGQKVNGLIYQYNHETDSGIKESIIDDLSKTDIGEALISDDLVDEFNDNSMSYLSSLWNYVNSRRKLYSARPQELVRDRNDSLDDWTEKLFRNYDAIETVAMDPDLYDLRVAKISDGEINLIDANKSNDVKVAYQKAMPINDEGVIGSNFKGRVKIGIVNPDSPTKIAVSGVGNVRGGAKLNSTFIMFPNRNGTWQEVNVYGQKLNEKSISETGKQIVTAFTDEIGKAIDRLHKAGRNEYEVRSAINDLYNLFLNAYYTKDNSMFSGFNVYKEPDGTGFHIYNKDTQLNIYFKYGGISHNYIEIFNYATGKRKIFDFNKNIETAERTNINGVSRYDFKKAEANESWINVEGLKKNLAKFIVDNTYMKLTTDYILHDADNAKHKNVLGLATIDNDGKFVVKIGDKSFAFNSYNDFLIDNNFIRVNTRSVDGKTNYSMIGSHGQRANANLEFRVEPKRPVEENRDSVSYKDKATKIITDNGTNKDVNTGEELAKALLGEDKVTRTDSKGVKKSKFKIGNASLLPKNIIFDPKFNDIKGYTTTNAESNVGKTDMVRADSTVKPGEVIVGTKFMSLLDSERGRNRAVRILIHERLHNLIHNKKYDYLDENGKLQNKIVDQIKEVYNDFRNAISDEKADAHIREFEFASYFDKDGNPTERSMEEFLVESMTNMELIDRLNNIKVDVPKTNTKKTLFSKILRLLGDIFGWDIKEGSLREKEVKALADILKEEPIEKEKTEKVENKKPRDTKNDKLPTIDNAQRPKAMQKSYKEGNLFSDEDFKEPTNNNNDEKGKQKTDKVSSNNNITEDNPGHSEKRNDTEEKPIEEHKEKSEEKPNESPKEEIQEEDTDAFSAWNNDDSDDSFLSNVDELIIDDDFVPTDNGHDVPEDAFYDRLPIEQKSAYKAMRESGLITEVCHG